MNRPLPLGWLLAAVILVVVPAALWLFGSAYAARLAQLVLITALLAAALNLLIGTAGLLSLDTVVYYGFGAYLTAILSTNYGTTLPTEILAAAAAGALLGGLIGWPLVRLASIFFAVATMGLATIFHTTVLNWVDLTRGPMGYRGIPAFKLGEFTIDGWAGNYYVIAVVVLGGVWIVHRLTHSYYGNAMRAAREDEDCARAMGLSPHALKLQAYAVHASLMSVAGALYAHANNFLSPDNFVLLESGLTLTAVVVGGLGSLPGAFIGALVVVLVPELLRPLGNLRAFGFGMILFLSILFLPRGLWSEVSSLAFVRRHLFREGWLKR
ncbi:MAG: branched-chain amino acid ABC transporter permease [Betaproteobacteria bacterium]|nr:branched-chain amino acid ABC transporter permease [Betaproteobacteria bacterium]